MVNVFRRNPKPGTKLRHIAELDGLRGIAALAVFFNHLSFVGIDPSAWNAAIVSLYSVGRYGQYGVDLFFVLSGYLITSILLQARNSPHYYHNFYWKRALRILPLYLIALLVAWIWFRASAGGVLLSIFFLANFSRVFHVTLGGPYWTLAIEEQFYLIWPQFVHRWSADRLQKLAWGIVIAEPILRLIDAAFHHDNFFFTFFRCDGLAFGALLACQLYRRETAPPTATRFSGKMFAVWILLIGCVFLVVTGKLMFSPQYKMQATALFLSAISLGFYACIRIAVENSGARFLAVFRSRILVFFGLISYCMYLSHTYVTQLYDRCWGPLQAGNSLEYWRRVAFVLGATLVVCVISRYAVELPCMSLRKYVLRPPKLADSSS